MTRKTIVASGLFTAIVSGVALGTGLHNYPIGMLLGTSVGTATALVIGDQESQHPHESNSEDRSDQHGS